MVQDIIFFITIRSNNCLTLYQMVHVLKSFQDTTNMLYAHKARLDQVIPLILRLNQALGTTLELGLKKMAVHS